MLEESIKRVQRLESRDTRAKEFISELKEDRQELEAREEKLRVIIAQQFAGEEHNADCVEELLA